MLEDIGDDGEEEEGEVQDEGTQCIPMKIQLIDLYVEN